MHWIISPSLLIWLVYYTTTVYSDSIFQEAHLFDRIGIFGWEINLEEYISGVEWFYFLVLFEVFKFIVLTLLSPFNSFISELYDQKLTGDDFKFSFVRMLKDILRGLVISIIGLSLEMLLTGFWLVFCLFLPIDSLTPLFFMFISSFFFGFGYMDYSLERHNFDVNKSWSFAFKNFKSCFVIGFIFSSIMYIPHAGIIIAPPLITLLATDRFIQLKRDQPNKTN
jgi:CysZ protein